MFYSMFSSSVNRWCCATAIMLPVVFISTLDIVDDQEENEDDDQVKIEAPDIDEIVSR